MMGYDGRVPAESGLALLDRVQRLAGYAVPAPAGSLPRGYAATSSRRKVDSQDATSLTARTSPVS